MGSAASVILSNSNDDDGLGPPQSDGVVGQVSDRLSRMFGSAGGTRVDVPATINEGVPEILAERARASACLTWESTPKESNALSNCAGSTP